MNIKNLKLTAALLLLSTINHQLSTALAQGTAFTYQGRLTVGGNSSTNGTYDFRFQAAGNSGVGGYVGSQTTVSGVTVSNGLFTATLDLGAGIFTGPDRWLEISVRTNNGVGGYTTLNPRQPLKPAPYAIYSANAAQLGGQGATAYVAKAGDTMSGALNLPANGLVIAGNQLVASGGNVGIGTINPEATLSLYSPGVDLLFKLEDRRTATTGDFLCKQAFYDYGGEAAYIGLRHNLYFGSGPRALTFGLTGTERMRIASNGNLGIGTTSPQSALHVVGASGNYGYLGDPTRGVFGCAATAGGVGVSGLHGSTGNYGYLGAPGAGVYGYSASGNAGQFQGAVKVINPTGFGLAGVQIEQPASFDFARMRMGVTSFPYWDISVSSGTSSDMYFVSGGNYNMVLRGNGNAEVRGTTTTCALTITGGCDLSEPFHMSSAEVPKGSLVIIDEENPGQLRLSDCAYDTRVAGIVSGANGIKPGISLHQEGTLEGGENVALSGRVYALADASGGAIEPGDLLTTSETPGHCMKATDHAKAQGAIIGKAMSSLNDGKGMVLVLVSLQ